MAAFRKPAGLPGEIEAELARPAWPSPFPGAPGPAGDWLPFAKP